MIKNNPYLNSTIGGILGGITFFLIKYLLSKELDFFTPMVFGLVLGITYALTHKFFTKKK